jgi:hypothetical protein
MMQFESYRWEDHAPRPGRWKFDLVLAVAAFAALATVLRLEPPASGTPAFVREASSAPLSRPAASNVYDSGAPPATAPSHAETGAFCPAVNS